MEVTENTNEVSFERKKISKHLLKFAWTIEIFAVAIGLAIAIMQGLTSFKEIHETNDSVGFGSWANILIAVLPFVMVAIVELTKIPFVQAFYKSKLLRWKIIFGTSLLFIAFITFESAMNGFERNYSAMMYNIDKYKKELTGVEEIVAEQENQRTRLEKLTADQIESTYITGLKQISAERDEAAKIINQRIADIRGSVESEVTRNLEQNIAEQRAQKATRRSDLANELQRLSDEHNASIQSLSEDLRIQRENLNRQLNFEMRELEQIRQQGQKDISDASFLTENNVRKRVQDEVANKEQKINEIRDKLNNLTIANKELAANESYQKKVADVRRTHNDSIRLIDNQISRLTTELQRSLGQRQSDVTVQLKTHEDELQKLFDTFTIQQQELEQRRANDLARLDGNTEQVQKLTAEIQALKVKRLELRDIINQRVGDNQIYRMAQWFYDKESAADLQRSQVASIAVIWFGSLAALIAFTGIILALASCAIDDPKNSHDNTKHRNSIAKFWRSMRSYFVYRRRRYKDPIIHEVPRDVIKEVPVDRVVKVEVPVEVIKKEVVHVPFYTNDKSLIEISAGHEKFFRHQGSKT